jgi:enoyl-CoA hydratase/carnithine racemase
MRSDRGFFCLPEVDLGIPFLPGMTAMLKTKIPPQLLIEMQLTGKRYTAPELESRGSFLKACKTEPETVAEAIAFAKSLNKERKIVGDLRRVLYEDAVKVIDTVDPSYIELSTLGG